MFTFLFTMSIYFFVIFMLILLPLMNTPMTLGGTILFLTFFSCLILAMASMSWFSYILFLIYIGGLMVMFIYVCLLSSNYIFIPLPQLMFIFIGILSFILSLFYNFQLNNLILLDNLEGLITGSELSEMTNLSLLVSLAIILFINLLAVVYVSGNSSVRSFQTGE
uniref:ND6 protein n=1 Tax=Valvata hokkaidoensis TaxID=96458 RepID=A0A7R7T1R9_9GAST|nr:ND6 [Valvata hokkaidoensis]